jgi:hypothetical protein
MQLHDELFNEDEQKVFEEHTAREQERAAALEQERAVALEQEGGVFRQRAFEQRSLEQERAVLGQRSLMALGHSRQVPPVGQTAVGQLRRPPSAMSDQDMHQDLARLIGKFDGRLGDTRIERGTYIIRGQAQTSFPMDFYCFLRRQEDALQNES